MNNISDGAKDGVEVFCCVAAFFLALTAASVDLDLWIRIGAALLCVAMLAFAGFVFLFVPGV